MAASVSIIVPIYNAERFLRQTIQSVQDQTFSDWEMMIVIDANSGDGSQIIAEAAAANDPRIRMLAVGTRGVVANRNLGIAKASAPFLAFVDSDDWWHPKKLEKQLAFMRVHNSPLSTTGYYRVTEDGKTVRTRIEVTDTISYRDMLYGNHIGCLTAMVDRRAFADCTFPAVLAEDYALWLRLLRNGAIASGLNEPLAYYREVKGSRSSKLATITSWRWEIFRNQEKLSIFQSLFYSAAGMWSAIYRRALGRVRRRGAN